MKMKRTEWIRKGLMLGLLAALASVLVVSPAAAQDPCVEYPNAAGCQPGGGDGNNDDDPVGAGQNLGDLGDGDGSLPFTGYPLTPLALLVLLLLTLGACIRIAAIVRARTGSA